MRNWKHRLLAGAMTAALLVGLLPSAALAADNPAELDISQGNITITKNGYKVGEVDSEIPHTGDYIITSNGTQTANTITVDYGITSGVNITLQNVNISTEAGHAIYANSNINLTLEGENSLTAAGYNMGEGGIQNYGVIYSWDITIDGGDNDALNVTATNNIGCGIRSPGNSSVTISGGTVTVESNNFGIYGDAGITISGGTVNAKNGTTYGIFGGTITISGGTVDATGISGSTVIISGDSTVVNTTGDIYGTDGSGGNVTINGGTVTATADCSIYSGNGNTTISGGKLIIPEDSMLTIASGQAITVDKDGVLENNGTIEGAGVIDLSGGGELIENGNRVDVGLQYNVDYSSLSNISAGGSATKANDKADYTATLEADSGYELPESISMTMGGTAFTDFTYTQTTGVLSIEGEKITGNIVITAAGVLEAPSITGENYSAIYTGNNHEVGATATHDLAGAQLTYTVYKLNGTQYEQTGITTSTGKFNVTNVAESGKYKIVASITDGTQTKTAEKEITVTITKATPTVTDPTASAITYGQTLANSTLTTGWVWADSTTVPTVTNSGYTAYYNIQDEANYEWTGFNDYDPVNHRLARTVSVTVSKVDWPNQTASGSAKYGTTGTVDLSSYIAPGGEVGSISVSDATLVMQGNLEADGTTLSFACVDNSNNIGKTATITIPVTGADNYNDYSIVVTVTVTEKPPQSDFKFEAATQTRTYGDADFIVTATGAASGSTVTYESGNGDVATVDNGGKVHIIRAGSTTITATASATNDYEETSATYTLIVKKKPIPVPAADTTVYTYNGKEQTYQIAKNDAYEINGNQQTNAGTYTVTVTLTDEDNTEWLGENKGYTFTIEKATVTITAENKTAVVGSAKPELTYAVSGLAAGDTLGGTVTLDCDANMDTVGSYPIIASGGAVPNTGNYNADITYVNGTLSVTAKPSTGGGGGGGGSTPSKPQNQPNTSESGGWNEIQTELKDTAEQVVSGDIRPGETVAVEMNGATEVPKEVLKEIAGSDVAVAFDMGGGVTWEINGQDIPAGIGDLDLGVKVGGKSIPVSIIDTVAGETSTVQLELSHNGSFGTTLNLSVNVGRENGGSFANLYYYNEVLKELVFQHASRIDAAGRASWPFDHASSYAIVIDEVSHDPNWVNPFADVSGSDWFYSAVEYVNRHGLMAGTSGTTFSPGTTTTRGMIAAILWRLSDSPVVNYAMNFTDVDPAAYYGEAIRWATSVGVVAGYGNGTFGPNDPITREQLAVMLYRYAQVMGYDAGARADLSGYTDAGTVSGYAVDAMAWAVEQGIISGTSATTLSPKGQATRAQAAAMLMRFIEGMTK